MASPQPPLPENKLSVALLKSIPLSIGCNTKVVFQKVCSGRSGCNTKVVFQKVCSGRSGCNTKVELQKRSGCNTKGSGCNTKVELQKGSGCNTKVELQKGSGRNTKVELQKGSGCNTKVELGPKTLHCLDVPKVHPHCFGASIVQGGGVKPTAPGAYPRRELEPCGS